MTAHPVGDTTEGTFLCDDVFTDDRPLGAVVGSTGPHGAARIGIDVESQIGIDHGALRIEPLTRPGWGRQAIAYGPFEAAAGLTFVAHVLNGHNASQTFYFPETPRQRLRRRLGGLRRGVLRRPHHHENLAVGFVGDPGNSDPLRDSSAFVVHAADGDNGELWATELGRPIRLFRGMQNLPFLFVVACRADGGAAFFVSSLPNATGASAYPTLRPLAVTRGSNPRPGVFAAIQQRILGEVGYRVATRVYASRAAIVPQWDRWWGSAELADRLTGEGRVVGSEMETGVVWQASDGPGPERGADGARSADGSSSGAVGIAAAPVGLVRAVVTSRRSGGAELRWGTSGAGHWAVRLDQQSCQVVQRDANGETHVLAVDQRLRARRGKRHAVQLVDNGTTVAVHVDGQLLEDRWLPRPSDVRAFVGFTVTGDASVSSFEAHPLDVMLPATLDVGAPWQPAKSAVVLDERFDRQATDLDGVTTPSGGRRWERSEGIGCIELGGGGEARVAAERNAPNPDRTIFTVPWDHAEFAELTLDMTPPGVARGEGENGRCGVVFWQDADNYLIVNIWLDDVYDGASISSFYRVAGHEDMYDAVWTLNRGFHWGQRSILRVAFDGNRFLASADDEPALVRAITDVYPDAAVPLRIERVGIVANEEWGNDTGTTIHRFTAARALVVD
jgi:hypothetical protein